MDEGFDYSLYYQTLPRRRKKNQLYVFDSNQTSRPPTGHKVNIYLCVCWVGF